MWVAVPGPSVEYFSDTRGEELLCLENENSTDFEKLSTSGNLRGINLTHGDNPCHFSAQTVWYPEKSNLGRIWEVEEIRAIGLPDHQQKVTIFVVSSMLALRWIEENVIKYRESKHQPWRRYTLLILAGGLSYLRLLARY